MSTVGIPTTAEQRAKDKALIEAVLNWWAEHECGPDNPCDAELMKACWRHNGDNTEPCPECDGDCGEPCAPISAEAACRSLDAFSADWRKRHGYTKPLPKPRENG